MISGRKVCTTEDLADLLHQPHLVLDYQDRPSRESDRLYSIYQEVTGGQYIRDLRLLRGYVHEYQKVHRVSAITYKTVTIGKETAEFPVPASNLSLLPGDLDQMRWYRDPLLNCFCNYVRENSPLFLYHPVELMAGGCWDIETTLEGIQQIVEGNQWVILGDNGADTDSPMVEYSLRSGFGHPDPLAMDFRDRGSISFYCRKASPVEVEF